MEADDTPPTPEFEVWNHVASGLQMARDDLRNTVGNQDAALFDAIAEQVMLLNVGVLVTENDAPLPKFLVDSLPEISAETWRKAVRMLPQDPTRWKPVLRHAVEIKIAERAIKRMYSALDRYGRLQPLLVSRKVPPRAKSYIQELGDAFLLGFDAACIALSGACFEQVAKAALVATGATTEPQLKRSKPTADGLRLLLRQHDLLKVSATAAERLVSRRNTILHQHMFDARILSTLSLDSIREFLEVCEELAPSWSGAT